MHNSIKSSTIHGQTGMDAEFLGQEGLGLLKQKCETEEQRLARLFSFHFIESSTRTGSRGRRTGYKGMLELCAG